MPVVGPGDDRQFMTQTTHAGLGGAAGATAGIAKQSTINTTKTLMKRFMGRFLLVWDLRFQQPLFRRLGPRQEVLHHPDFKSAHAGCESEVVTVRVKRNLADRIHRQPQRVRFSATGRNGK